VNGLLAASLYLGVLLAPSSPWAAGGAGGDGAADHTVQKAAAFARIREWLAKRLTVSQVRLGSRITEDHQGLRLLHSLGQLGGG